MAEKKRIYRLVGFVRVEPENQKPMTLDEAKKEQEHCEAMQPENMYVIERVEIIEEGIRQARRNDGA